MLWKLNKEGRIKRKKVFSSTVFQKSNSAKHYQKSTEFKFPFIGNKHGYNLVVHCTSKHFSVCLHLKQ